MEMIAFQLDLGRQKESIDYIKEIVSFTHEYGYNTIVLYLENCVRTSDTEFFNKDETYSMDEMKEIVSFVESLGMDCIPAFETLGHLEKFLDYKELSSFSEVEDCSKKGRGWWYPRYVRGQNGCVSNEELFSFMSKYVKDVSSLFNSKYIHMGLDEIFDFAICDKCKERLNNGETKESLFKDYIIKCNNLVKSMGKTMMMWDDFFEYFDCVKDLPRDIIMCTWNYYYINDKLNGKWTNRTRRDNFKIYDDLGFKYILCTIAHDSSSTYNIDSLTEYSFKFNPIGALMTSWERSNTFFLGMYPSIAYGGLLWNNKINNEEDVLNLYESIIKNRDIADLILSTQVSTIMSGYTDSTKMSESDYFIKYSMRKEYSYVLKKLKDYRKTISGITYDIITDIYDFILDKYLNLKLQKISTLVFDYYESKKNNPKILLDINEVIEGYKELKSNTDSLWKKYRPNILSTNNSYETYSTWKIENAERIKNEILSLSDSGVLYLNLMMHDAFSTVKGEVRVKYKNDDKETVVYTGGIKPSIAEIEDGACYSLRFKILNKELEYAVFDCFGEGGIWPLYMYYKENNIDHELLSVEALYGYSNNLSNMYINDTKFAELGYNSGYDHLYDCELFRKRSGIKITFK